MIWPMETSIRFGVGCNGLQKSRIPVADRQGGYRDLVDVPGSGSCIVQFRSGLV